MKVKTELKGMHADNTNEIWGARVIATIGDKVRTFFVTANPDVIRIREKGSDKRVLRSWLPRCRGGVEVNFKQQIGVLVRQN